MSHLGWNPSVALPLRVKACLIQRLKVLCDLSPSSLRPHLGCFYSSPSVLQLCWHHAVPQTLLTLCLRAFALEVTSAQATFTQMSAGLAPSLIQISAQVHLDLPPCYVYPLFLLHLFHDIFHCLTWLVFLYCLSHTGMSSRRAGGLSVLFTIAFLVPRKYLVSTICYMNWESQGRLIRAGVLHLWKREDIKSRIWWRKWGVWVVTGSIHWGKPVIFSRATEEALSSC